MSKYEVFIPPPSSDGTSIILRVDAANWMAALKTGLQRLGEQGNPGQNVLVDIQADNSIHVTEGDSGRVFRIRELTDEEAATAPVKSPPILAAPPPSSHPVFADDLGKTQPSMRPLPVTHPSRPPGLKRRDSEPELVVELLKSTQPLTGAIGRTKETALGRDAIEEVLSDVFQKVSGVYSRKTVEEALYFLLDLAMEKIPADSGSVYLANARTGELTFAAARGPKAQELMASKLVVPPGVGIAGFCTTEGVSVAVSDVEKDPRFYSAVSERLGYQAKSMLCSPMMTQGRAFGCVQLINKKESTNFRAHEVGLLSYVAHQGALFLSSRT